MSRTFGWYIPTATAPVSNKRRVYSLLGLTDRLEHFGRGNPVEASVKTPLPRALKGDDHKIPHIVHRDGNYIDLVLIDHSSKTPYPGSEAMSIMATRSLDIASNHVTVTKRQNAAWPSTTVANKKNSSPSLYLIVFLTLLLLIIMTSTIIFARGHLVRRRVRMEIQAAVDRGEITQARGNQISSRLATMTFGLGRWSNSWVRMVADDYEAAENRRTTRRRKKAKDYGEPPKLFDIDLSGGPDEKSALFSLINQPFALHHPSADHVLPAETTSLQQALSTGSNPASSAPVSNNQRETSQRPVRHFGMRPWPTSLFRDTPSRSSTMTPQVTPSTAQPQTISYPPTQSVEPPSSEPSSTSKEKHKGEMWIERVDQPSESEGKEYPLEASFIIRMPESEESVRVRERIRDEEGMEMLHGHLEIGIWKGILRT